jgi:hypothetical protein
MKEDAEDGANSQRKLLRRIVPDSNTDGRGVGRSSS